MNAGGYLLAIRSAALVSVCVFAMFGGFTVLAGVVTANGTAMPTWVTTLIGVWLIMSAVVLLTGELWS